MKAVPAWVAAAGAGALAWGVSGLWLWYQPDARIAVAAGVFGIVFGITGSRRPRI